MNVNSLKVLLTSLPGRYTCALFNEGKKSDCLDEILENFDKLDTFFKSNQSVKKILTSSCINEKELHKGWIALGEHLSFCPVFLSFVRQVVSNNRFDIINKIKFIYNVALAKHRNKRDVVVSSAVALLPEQKKRLEKLIVKAMPEKTIIKYKIDENILGGIKIRSEELVIDASSLSKIKQLAHYLKSSKIKVDEYED